MEIGELKTGENTAVPVDDLVERLPGEDLPRPRHENGCSVTECDILILQNNLRYAISRSEELERHTAELVAAETRRKAEADQAAAQIADLTNRLAALENVANDTIAVLQQRREKVETEMTQALVELHRLRKQTATKE